MPHFLWMLLAGCEICDVHSECSGDQLCWDGVCTAATDRVWNVEVSAAEVGMHHPDGYPWDGVDGPPDLYAEFGLPPDVCFTDVVPQSFDPVWYQSCDFYVPHDPLFAVDLWDVDDAVDELGAAFTWDGTPAWVDLARTAGRESAWVDESSSVVLWMYLEPR
jgi:hypothetical protein